MGLRKATPGEGGRKAHVHFGYVKTPANKSWDAWVAGPCYWLIAHTSGRSKPCLEWMTSGELACPRCASVVPPEEIGYQPLYRDIDGRPVMVIVHAYTRELVDALKFRQQVIVSRGADDADPVTIRAATGRAAWYSSTLPERQHPADLTETLLRVWGIHELVSWYRAQGKSDNAVSPQAPVKSDGKPFSPMTAAAAQKHDAQEKAAKPIDNGYDAIIERVKGGIEKLQPSANGKHKPKG